jgi:hypothetical protein
MRGLTSTIVLAAVLAGLGAYIYFVDRHRPATEPNQQVFATVSADDIEEIEIRTAEGEHVRARRNGDAWTLVDPEQADADVSELSSITSSLASLDIRRVVDEEATDFSQYGLEPGRIDVGFRTRGSEQLRRIVIGDRAPAGGDVYARLPGENRVFLVASYLESTFNKDAFALRDKRVLRFARDEADGLELTAGTTALHFAKDGSEWRLLKPLAARADYSTVEAAVQRLASAQMHSIVASEAGDLRKYGLDRPVATMTVTIEGTRTTLALGSTDNALVFARDESRPMIFTVAPTLQTDVIKDVSDYRRKDLFDARSFTTTRLALRRSGEQTVLEKSTTDEDTTVWRDPSGAEVERETVEGLLSSLSFLRAQSFDAAVHPSLKTPELEAELRFGEDKSETVTFARAGDDVFARRADEPGMARVDASAYDEVIQALDALKAPEVQQ